MSRLAEDATSSPGAASEAAGVHACTADLRRAFEFLGKRWNGVILATLDGGPTGFADLRRRVGSITDSVLSDRLAELVAAGLVERTVTDARPPGVSYALTDAGRDLTPVLRALGSWAADALPASRC